MTCVFEQDLFHDEPFMTEIFFIKSESCVYVCVCVCVRACVRACVCDLIAFISDFHRTDKKNCYLS